MQLTDKRLGIAVGGGKSYGRQSVGVMTRHAIIVKPAVAPAAICGTPVESRTGASGLKVYPTEFGGSRRISCLRCIAKIERMVAALNKVSSPIVEARKSRSTGTRVELIDTRHPDNIFDPEGGRWVTVCVEHGTVCNHATRPQARAHMPVVDWCEPCMEAVN